MLEIGKKLHFHSGKPVSYVHLNGSLFAFYRFIEHRVKSFTNPYNLGSRSLVWASEAIGLNRCLMVFPWQWVNRLACKHGKFGLQAKWLSFSIFYSHYLPDTQQENTVNPRYGHWGAHRKWDHFTFLGSCLPTPPPSQHFALSAK